VIDFLKDVLPQQDPRQITLNELYPDRTSAGTIASGLMKGYNPVSGGFLYGITDGRLGEPTTFGLEEAYNTRIANVRETLSRQYGLTKDELDQIEAGNITAKIKAKAISPLMSETYGKPTVSNNVQKLADLAAGKKAEQLALRGATSLVTGDIDKDPTGDASIAETLAARDRLGFIDDIGVEGEDEDRFIDNIGGGIDQGAVDLGTMDTTAPDIVNVQEIEEAIKRAEANALQKELEEYVDPIMLQGDTGGGGEPPRDDDKPAPSGPPSTGFTAPTKQGQSPRGSSPAAVSTAGQAGPPSQRGGGKIVCTMMNESYGFGSFRNKIWLKHSKDLAPEYQIGYHKIFLPLVKLSKKNIVLKKALEHIAVHRTIDIRQESRGKVHLLGRVYRKILEPICYWVGKNAKR
jgi:hypothetical protein